MDIDKVEIFDSADFNFEHEPLSMNTENDINASNIGLENLGNDFTFDVSAFLPTVFADTTLESANTSVKAEQPNNSDFTLDVSQILPHSSDTRINNVVNDQSCGDFDFTFDVSSFLPSSTNLEFTPANVMNNEANTEISFDQVFDHEEVVRCDSDDDDSVPSTDDIKIDAQLESHKFKIAHRTQKVLDNIDFFRRNNEHLHAAYSICHNNCTPYIASCNVNEELKWPEKQEICRELSSDEILDLYQIKKPSTVLEPSRKRRCISKPKSVEEAIKQTCLSQSMKRVVRNEVIMNAEGTSLSGDDITEISKKTEDFITQLFAKLFTSGNTGSKKCSLINRTVAKNVASELFRSPTKEDYLAELIIQKPKWTAQMRKKHYRLLPAIKALLDDNIKLNYYSKNFLIKDLS